MAAPTAIPVVDADMHVTEVDATWEAIDAGMAAHRLNIVTERGHRWLRCGDRPVMLLRPTEPGEVDRAREDPQGWEQARAVSRRAGRGGTHPAESDMPERVRVLDATGVDSAILFPSYGLFWPSVVPEGEIADANFAAWNTWIAERCAIDSQRLLGVAQFSLADVGRAVKETWRCADLGLRGMFLRAVPYRGVPWGDSGNEPVWAALEESGLALWLHSAPETTIAHDSAWDKGLDPRHVGLSPLTFCNRSLPAEAALVSLVLAGVLERHPRLRIGVAEFGAAWVPSFLRRIDYTLDFLSPRNRYLRSRLATRPSEYVRRQVCVSAFWSEDLDWLLRDTPGEIYMFSSDFPHPEGSELALAQARVRLDGLADDVRASFLGGAARRCIGLESARPQPVGAAGA